MRTSIATVSVSGTLEQKLTAIAAVGFDAVEIFETDLARSKRVTREAWEQRPWSEKLLEHAAALLRTQL